MDFILTTQMRTSKRGAFDTDFVDCFFLYESRVSLGVKNCAFEQKHILKYQYQLVGILNRLPNKYKITSNCIILSSYFLGFNRSTI